MRWGPRVGTWSPSAARRAFPQQVTLAMVWGLQERAAWRGSQSRGGVRGAFEAAGGGQPNTCQSSTLERGSGGDGRVVIKD